MRPQLIPVLVPLTTLACGLWACATATTGDTSESGANDSAANNSNTSSGGASSAATSVVSSTVGQTTSNSVGGSSTTGNATTNAGSTTGAATTGAAANTTAAATTGSSTTGSSSSTGCSGSGISGAEPIVPSNGWVACGTNAAGIEGAFFTFGDGITSTITPANFEASGSEVCVSGEVGQVVEGDYTVYGAGVGFNFADEAAYDATANGVSGVSFNISTLPAATDTRIIFTTAAGDHCMVLASAGAQTVSFAQTTLDCWETGGAKPAEAGIISVKWQVTTNATSTHAFDFCITDFAVVP